MGVHEGWGDILGPVNERIACLPWTHITLQRMINTNRVVPGCVLSQCCLCVLVSTSYKQQLQPGSSSESQGWQDSIAMAMDTSMPLLQHIWMPVYNTTDSCTFTGLHTRIVASHSLSV